MSAPGSRKDKSHLKHNVRFPEGQSDECNKIHVVKAAAADSDIEIHAGFFKMDHKYEINFVLDDEHNLGNDARFEAANDSSLKLRAFQVKTSKINLTLEYFPPSDGEHGVVDEFFKILSPDRTRAIRAVFRAEILGRDQGTPMLKDGVRCVQRPTSSTSSMSSH